MGWVNVKDFLSQQEEVATPETGQVTTAAPAMGVQPTAFGSPLSIKGAKIGDFTLGIDPIQQQQQAANIQVQKEVGAQKAKDISKMQQDVERADAALSNTFRGWLDNISWNYDTYGFKPGGVVGGLKSKITGITRKNPYWEGFHGSTLEYGAAIARIAMPGIRAARVIDTFKQTAPSDWSTVESGVYNSALSFRSAISKDIATNPNDYLDLLGSDFKSLDTVKKSQRKREVLDKLQDQYEMGLYKAIYKVEPKLFRDKKLKDRIENAVKLQELGLDPNQYEIVE